jgi:hypothetical protein
VDITCSDAGTWVSGICVHHNKGTIQTSFSQTNLGTSLLHLHQDNWHIMMAVLVVHVVCKVTVRSSNHILSTGLQLQSLLFYNYSFILILHFVHQSAVCPILWRILIPAQSIVQYWSIATAHSSSWMVKEILQKPKLTKALIHFLNPIILWHLQQLFPWPAMPYNLTEALANNNEM